MRRSDPNTKGVQKQKRNQRERNRVNQVNKGFNDLRERVPRRTTSKKLSKVETLREAARYIEQLRAMLNAESTPMRGSNGNIQIPPAFLSSRGQLHAKSFQENFSTYAMVKGEPSSDQSSFYTPSSTDSSFSSEYSMRH